MPIEWRIPAEGVAALPPRVRGPLPFGGAHPGVLVAMLLLVVASFGVVAAGVVRTGLHCPPEYTARAEAQAIANAFELHGVKTAATPGSLQALVPGELRELRADPWGHPYRLVSGVDPIVVVSDGRDGVPGTDDDVASSPRDP